ncbi:hypothetical protein IG631_20202 [Alternaria alternata]|nr:hypothetical protein IG631_20202 [Alternaria alternata]
MVPTPDWHLSIEHILSDRSRRLVSRHVSHTATRLAHNLHPCSRCPEARPNGAATTDDRSDTSNSGGEP